MKRLSKKQRRDIKLSIHNQALEVAWRFPVLASIQFRDILKWDFKESHGWVYF